MKSGMLRFITTIVTMLMLVLTSCGPKAVPVTSAPAPTPLAPAPVAPVATPTPTTPAPAVQGDMISVTLKKLDGSTMRKQVEKPKYGGTLSLRATADPVWDLKLIQGGSGANQFALDKLLFGDWTKGTAGTGEISWQVFEYYSMDHFMPWLAERWEMPDDQTIVYHLRRGIRWALDSREASQLVGGRELTADDVVFSFKWLLFSEPKTTMRRFFGGVENADIRALDKYTVVVKAPKQELNQFVGYMSDVLPVFPPEVIQKYGNFTNWDKVVGSGAFMLKDFVASSATIWVKNPNFFGYDPVLGKDYRLPYVDSIKYLNIVDESTAQAAFRTGKLDGTLNLTKEMSGSLIKTYPIAKTKIINFGTGSNRIAMQMNDPKAPWQDIRVRRALMMAINRPYIIDNYYGGAADPHAFPLAGAPELYAMGWAIPLKELPRETQMLFEYHPDEAKKLLAEAGYPNGFKTSLMLGGNNAELLDLGALIKADWAKIGVDLTLDVREPVLVTAYVNNANYSAMIPDSKWGNGTLYAKFEPPPSSNNAGNIVDPRLQELRMKMFDVLWDFEKRTPIMKELYKYSMSQVWFLSLPSKWGYKVYQPWVKNYDAEASVGYFGQAWPFVWLDSDLKKKLGY